MSSRYTILDESIDLSGSNFAKDVDFRDDSFRYADFSGATFNGEVIFWGTAFSNSSFNDTTFEGADFSEASFGNVSFLGSTFRSPVNFDGAVFKKDVSFTDSGFLKDACFTGVRFLGDVDFNYSVFNYYTYFHETQFLSDAAFSKVNFAGTLDISSSNFTNTANFFGSEFGDIIIMDTLFLGPVQFGLCRFAGLSSFYNATFAKEAGFNMVSFGNAADFSDSRFQGDALFALVKFGDISSFQAASFDGKLNLKGSAISSMILDDASFGRLCKIRLNDSDFNRLKVHWSEIEDHLVYDEGAYLSLIKNYNNLGWYNDANECYYDYRNAVRENWLTASAPNIVARISNVLNWFIDTIEWLLYGYGVKPLFTMVWSVIFILAFGLFFMNKKCLKKIVSEERIEDSIDKSNEEVLITTITRKAQITSLDSFFFSLFTFTSGFTSFLHPSIEYRLEGYIRWAIAERLLGPFFIALFITAISRTYFIR